MDKGQKSVKKFKMPPKFMGGILDGISAPCPIKIAKDNITLYATNREYCFISTNWSLYNIDPYTDIMHLRVRNTFIKALSFFIGRCQSDQRINMIILQNLSEGFQ